MFIAHFTYIVHDPLNRCIFLALVTRWAEECLFVYVLEIEQKKISFYVLSFAPIETKRIFNCFICWSEENRMCRIYVIVLYCFVAASPECSGKKLVRIIGAYDGNGTFTYTMWGGFCLLSTFSACQTTFYPTRSQNVVLDRYRRRCCSI